MLKDLCLAGVECFSDVPGPDKRLGYKNIVASIISLLLAIFIIALIGKYVWNETMPQLFTFARPVQSCGQIIGLLILFSLFR
jgi:hypothetical protein